MNSMMDLNLLQMILKQATYKSATKNKDVDSMKANLKATMQREYGVDNAMHMHIFGYDWLNKPEIIESMID